MKLKLKLWKMLRPVLQGISFTSVAFVFQACYGPRIPPEHDETLIKGTVVSARTGNAIVGIKVIGENQTMFTDTVGKFTIRAEQYKEVMLQFKDIDAGANGGFYHSKDTVIATQGMSRIVMTVALDSIGN